jgi:ubiquinone/menaquinone biosynthesis C-methylase UbiE
MRVNLGCGDMPLEGYENYDIHPLSENIKYINLLEEKWPFEDSSIDEVVIHDVLEHLPNKLKSMMELWRIAKSTGKINIVVPIIGGPWAFADPTHITYWDRFSFDYFIVGQRPYERLKKMDDRMLGGFKVLEEKLIANNGAIYILLQPIK